MTTVLLTLASLLYHLLVIVGLALAILIGGLFLLSQAERLYRRLGQKRVVEITVVSSVEEDWQFPPRYSPTKGETHLGKTQIGRRAA